MELSYKYRPVFYLHSKEQYLPIDFNRYMEEAKLKEEKLKDETLQTYFLPQGMETPIIRDYFPSTEELTQVPLYVNTRIVPIQNGFKYYITYAHLYAYNGPETVCCCFQVGQHYADIEHVTLDVHVNLNGDVSLDRMYTSRHNGGVWVDRVDMEFNAQDRPIVYSSLNGHASYHKPGVYWRFWGFAKDRCERGILWDTSRLIHLPARNTLEQNTNLDWTFFRGYLGDGSVHCFGSKSFMTENEINQEYGASTLPWKWLF